MEGRHSLLHRHYLRDEGTGKVVHRYVLPFKKMKVPPDPQNMFKYRRAARRLSDWIVTGSTEEGTQGLAARIVDQAPPPQQEEYETRLSSLVRKLDEAEQSAQPASTGQPAQPTSVRKSPRLQATTAVAFEWARPRWVECPHRGAVLAGGDQHALLPRYHQCFNRSCVKAVRQWQAETPDLFEAGAGKAAWRVGKPLGTVSVSLPRSDVRNCMNDASTLAVETDATVELEDENEDWSSVAINLEGTPLGDSLGDAFRKASVVYRLVGKRWQQWILVLQSAALHSIGISQWGVYPLRSFTGTEERGDVIAPYYPGEIVYSGRTIDCEEAQQIVTNLVGRGHDRLLECTNNSGEHFIIDGKGLPPMWRANATTNIKKVKKSFRFTESGSAVAVRRISALPEDFMNLTLPDLLSYELLTTYGADYWRLIKKVGTRELPHEVGSD